MSLASSALVCVCLCLNVVTVFCQFGFFPQRDMRRQYGFGQNFFPNPRRITENLAGILHFQPGNQDRNQQYINPYNNIPGISNNRPIYEQYPPNYPNQRPNDVGFPGRGQDVPNDYVNFEQRPVSNPELNNNNGGLVSGINNGEPVFGNNGNSGLISGVNDGPAFPNNNNENGGFTSGNPNRGENVSENNKDDRPVFGEIEDDGAVSSYDDGKEIEPSPVMVVDNAENENIPVFGDRAGEVEESPADVPTSLSPLTPLPVTDPKNNFNFGGSAVFSNDIFLMGFKYMFN